MLLSDPIIHTISHPSDWPLHLQNLVALLLQSASDPEKSSNYPWPLDEDDFLDVAKITAQFHSLSAPSAGGHGDGHTNQHSPPDMTSSVVDFVLRLARKYWRDVRILHEVPYIPPRTLGIPSSPREGLYGQAIALVSHVLQVGGSDGSPVLGPPESHIGWTGSISTSLTYDSCADSISASTISSPAEEPIESGGGDSSSQPEGTDEELEWVVGRGEDVEGASSHEEELVHGLQTLVTSPAPQNPFPFDAHILPGTGRRTRLVIPALYISSAHHITTIASSILYQRYVLGNDNAVVGLSFLGRGKVCQVYFGWLEGDPFEDPTTLTPHFAAAELTASQLLPLIGLYDLTQPAHILALSRFIVALRVHSEEVLDASFNQDFRHLCWRRDHLRSERYCAEDFFGSSDTRSSIEKWLEGVPSFVPTSFRVHGSGRTKVAHRK